MKDADPRSRKVHWYLLAFSVPGAGAFVPMSLFTSSLTRKLSKKAIDESRKDGQIPNQAVLLSASYLGLQTTFEFTGTSPDPVPSVVSPQYLEAMAITLKSADPEGIECPYRVDEPHFVSEWLKGHAAAKLMRTTHPELALAFPQPSASAEEEHF